MFITPAATMFYTDIEARAEPTLSPRAEDPWTYVTENITQYFDVPKPTGAVLNALVNYGDELLKPCHSSAKNRVGQQACSVSEMSQWCGFTKAASLPTSVFQGYAPYANAAASFWKARSSKVSTLSTACPDNWAKPSFTDHSWLNMTIAHAKCYIAAHPV
ncbi:hypothetical protein HJFPF1_05535 [Paramyrothecium foliicola]|nr:hypothetical protein HJFPF1_05535 [Paramyrothecium foliicola]